MKQISALFLLILMAFPAFSQEKYWFFFRDKGPEAEELLQHPERYLSQAALERRANNGIAIDKIDLPVSQTYMKCLAGEGVKIHYRSRWLNAVSAEVTGDPAQIVKKCDYVVAYRKVSMLDEEHGESVPLPENFNYPVEPSYGYAAVQNKQINIPPLHERNLMGQGVVVAVLDAGFPGFDTLAAFQHLWDEKRVIAWYDFVEDNKTAMEDDSHGMQVASTIFANLPGEMIGTAPKASIIMARTENAATETHQEEDNWVAAAEWADSIGVDIIHSSLGYSTFDEGQFSYTYSDMDGETAIITQAADLAASRGHIVVTSAGNEGNGKWFYLTAPCDADSVLCVGAVDLNGELSGFSSRGPSADGRVKPDVTAMGSFTITIAPSGEPSMGFGTSYSAPIVAGMVACLRQAHPEATNMQVIQAIQMSASQYNNPDSLLGYGIPDAAKADSILAVWLGKEPYQYPSDVQVDDFFEGMDAFEGSGFIEGGKFFYFVSKEPVKSIVLSDPDGVVIETVELKDDKMEVKLKSNKWAPGFYELKIKMDSEEEYKMKLEKK